jgi:hypothetical protein
MSRDTKVRTEFLYIIHKKLAIRVSMFWCERLYE